MQASWQGSGPQVEAEPTILTRLTRSNLLTAVQVALLLVMTASLATRLWVDPWFATALIAITAFAASSITALRAAFCRSTRSVARRVSRPP